MVARPDASASRIPGELKWLILLYMLLIIYNSMFPLTKWQMPAVWNNPLMMHWPQYDSHSDIFVNLVAYLPLGLLLSLVLRREGKVAGLLIAVAVGFALSFGMEFLQQALPGRVSSVEDIFNNTAGTLAGAVLAFGLSPDSLTGRRVHTWRARRFAPGMMSTLALTVLLTWAAFELFPFVPYLGVGSIKAGLRPLVTTLSHPDLFDVWKFLADFCMIVGIGVLARIVSLEPVMPVMTLFIAGVIFLKITIAYQRKSAGQLGGLAAEKRKVRGSRNREVVSGEW